MLSTIDGERLAGDPIGQTRHEKERRSGDVLGMAGPLDGLEQQALFNQYDDTVPNIHANNKFVREQFVPMYSCPSELKPKQLLIPATQAPDGGTGNIQYMMSSYRGMAGVSATGFDQWAGYPSEVIVNMAQGAGLPGASPWRFGRGRHGGRDGSDPATGGRAAPGGSGVPG